MLLDELRSSLNLKISIFIGGNKEKEEHWNALIDTLIGTRVTPPLVGASKLLYTTL